MPLPPPPIQDKPGSFTWLEWYRQLRNYISTSGSVPWSVINFAGSSIADIVHRSHNLLTSIQGGSTGEYYHLTNNKHEELQNNIVYITTATGNINTESTVICNFAGSVTLTLPSAASYSGRNINIKTVTANTVVSASSDVVPLTSTTAGTAILAATAGKFAKLTSDGTNWIIMEAN